MKYFFVAIFFITVSLGVIFSKGNKQDMTVRATLPDILKVKELDPANITLADQYTVLEHIYSPLVEVNNKGEISSGLAEAFEWKGNEAHFTLRENFTLPSGKNLTPQDVIISLKRLMILNTNSHGKISSLLCPEGNLRKLDDPCPRMEIANNTVIFKLEQHTPFLFKLLASIDYAIIPKDSIDPKTLKITNFQETTGPYLFESDDKGKIVLKINKNHYHFSENAPQRIEYIIPKGNSINYLREDKLDIITTDDITVEPEEIIESATKYNFNLHKTLPIENNIITFTKSGMNKLSKERRLRLGKIIREAFQDFLKDSSNAQTTYQFFPILGEAGLKDQIHKIKEMFNKVDTQGETGLGVRLLVSPHRVEYMKKVIHPFLPKLEIEETKRFPDVYNDNGDFGDMVIVRTDTGFLEEISLISYSINFGFFGLDKKKNTQWLESYMITKNKDDRINLLNDLHYEALTEAYMVPLFHSSYVSLANQKWKINFSQFYSNSQLWHLRKN